MRLPRMRLTVQRLLILVALSAVCVCWTLRISEGLPAGWDAREFEKAVRGVVDPQGEAAVEVELLAWRTAEDERPLLYDSALAWARIDDKKRVRWALLELYRHPRDDPQWALSWASHTPMPVQYFNRPPSNHQIYQFVDEVRFGDFFKPTSLGFRTLNSRVRIGTWFCYVGEMPKRFFP